MKNKYRFLKILVTVILLGFLLSFSLKRFSKQDITDEKISVNGINARNSKDGTAIMNVLLEVTSTDQLKNIMNQIKRVEGVLDTFRLFN